MVGGPCRTDSGGRGGPCRTDSGGGGDPVGQKVVGGLCRTDSGGGDPRAQGPTFKSLLLVTDTGMKDRPPGHTHHCTDPPPARKDPIG